MKTLATYGTWMSALTGDYIAQASIKLSEPVYNDGGIYWLEGRPAEKGRQTVVRRNADGSTQDLLAAPWNVRSKANEYGGGCYCIGGGALYFCCSDDQQIYTLNLVSQRIEPITANPLCRFADLRYDAHHQCLLAVCEDHSSADLEPQNRLVMIDLRTPGSNSDNRLTTVDDRHDFIAAPQLSPCGEWLIYLTWDHPHMPWDASQLWLCRIDAHGDASEPRCIAGSASEESLFQPQWSPKGDLFWVSDCSNWWNLYTLARSDIERWWDQEDALPMPTAVFPHEAEYATPQWVFNMSTYGFLASDDLFATYTQDGQWHLLRLGYNGWDWQPTYLTTDLVSIANVHCEDGKALFVAASATAPLAIYQFADDAMTAVHAPVSVQMKSEDISIGRSIRFPTSDQQTAHGFFYAPTNAGFEAEDTALPPVIVIGHGGPTGATDPSFSYKIQFWTQRGFAVVDVNYRGSTGFGRHYRQALQRQWGVVDVQDLSAAAEFVTAQKWAHPQQRIIRGSSAGGYSVLAALTDTNTFDAGVTLYGIGDLETLATDTHKFESRYLDGLIGPYPEQQPLYRQRSPIHKVANIQCPVLVFQGQEDKVVPPAQAEQIVAAVKKQGLPVAYVLYPSEGHGFRQSTTIAHQLQAELYFYQQVFTLAPAAEDEPPITLLNWEPT